MKEIKKCFRCRKAIERGSNYYTFIEKDDEEVVSMDYAHRECWDNFLKEITNAENAKGMLEALKGRLTNLGILPKSEGEVIIK